VFAAADHVVTYFQLMWPFLCVVLDSSAGAAATVVENNE